VSDTLLGGDQTRTSIFPDARNVGKTV